MRATEVIIGAFRMFRSYGREFLLLLVPIAAISIAISYAMRDWNRQQVINSLEFGGGFTWNGLALGLLLTLLSAVITSAAAVLWHRRALLDEHVSWSIGNVLSMRVLAYLGWSILITLIVVLVVVVGVFGVGLVSGIFSLLSPFLGIIFIVPMFAVVFYGAVLFWRFSLKLPSCALGKPISLGESYSATAGQSWMLVRMTLLIVLIVLILMIPQFFLFQRAFELELLNTGFGFDSELANMTPEEIARYVEPNLFEVVYGAVIGAAISLYSVGVLSILYARFANKSYGDEEVFG